MRISACIIAKNEEKNLPRLLDSIKGKFDEIILVDTGSTDKTIEIAKNYGCKVYKREWNGFADARNFASSKATGDWIWHFDADFELEPQEYKKAIFFLKNIPENYDAVMIGVKNFDKNGIVNTYSSQIFIHRNKPYIKWVGKVHEYVDVNLSYGIPVFVNHYGYQDNDILYKKAKRNLKLLEDEIRNLDKDSENYLFKLFYLVQSYVVFLSVGKEKSDEIYSTAKKYIDEYFQIRENLYSGKPANVFDNHMLSYALTIYISKKKYKEAKTLLNNPLFKDSKYPDTIYYKGIVEYYHQNYKESVKNILIFLNEIDKAKRNLFIDGMNRIIESANKINEILNILEKSLSNLREEEKRKFEEEAKQLFMTTKGEYIGLGWYLILKSLNEKEKAKKLLKKLSRLSKDKLSGLRVVVEMVKDGEKEQAKKLLRQLQQV